MKLNANVHFVEKEPIVTLSLASVREPGALCKHSSLYFFPVPSRLRENDHVQHTSENLYRKSYSTIYMITGCICTLDMKKSNLNISFVKFFNILLHSDVFHTLSQLHKIMTLSQLH